MLASDQSADVAILVVIIFITIAVIIIILSHLGYFSMRLSGTTCSSAPLDQRHRTLRSPAMLASGRRTHPCLFIRRVKGVIGTAG